MKLIKSKKEVCLKDLPLLVGELKVLFQKPQVLLLEGNLGTGKTTFTRFLLETFLSRGASPFKESGSESQVALSSKGQDRNTTRHPCTESQSIEEKRGTLSYFVAGSPAFSIQHVYSSSYGLIHHVDLYRLKDSEDLESTGFWDIFADRAKTYLVILEWADRLNPDCLPLGWNYIKLRFLFGKTNSARDITVWTGRG